MSEDEEKIFATAALDQIKASMDDAVGVIQGKVREDLASGTDTTLIWSQLVVNIVHEFKLPTEGPGAYVFASALLKLAQHAG